MRLLSSKISCLSSGCLSMIIFLGGCQIVTKRAEGTAAETSQPLLVDEKYSLTADRKQFEELRKEVPEQKKKENDELALLTQFFADTNKPPSEIRSKFDRLLRKKREVFQKDMTKEREFYVREEKKRRDIFTKELEAERKDFQGRKVGREVRSEFYDQLDAKRKDFFSSERLKRDEFEEATRDKRKNFEDYAREKNNEFNQEMRAYTKRYEEMKRSAPNK